MVKKKLNAADLALAQETAEKYYKYECLATRHSSIIQAADSTAYAEAHATYVARCPVREGFTPSTSEIDDHIDLAERTAEIQCNSLLDHVTVVNAAVFLMRLYSLKAIAKNVEIYFAAMRLREELQRQNPYPGTPNPQSHVATPVPQPIVTPTPSQAGPPTVDVPPILHHLAEAFTLDAVVDLPRMEVSAADIHKFSADPDDLIGETFVFMDGDDESAFSVSTIMTVGKGSKKEKYFYVQYADEGDVSFPIKKDEFFELLAKSRQVIV